MSIDPRLFKFRAQRAQAKDRGIEWKLEFWEWLQIWEESGHFEERGHHKGEWVMGRNGDRGPYAADNVKIIRAETNNSEAQQIRRAKRAAGTLVALRVQDAPTLGALTKRREAAE